MHWRMLPVGISADGLMDPLTTSVAAILAVAAIVVVSANLAVAAVLAVAAMLAVAAILAVAVLLGVLGLGFSVALSKIKWGLGFKILWV